MSKNLSIITEVNRLANVTEYEFVTREGKPLKVTGELASDLSVYYGMSALGNKATFESAHRIRNIMNMTAETLNDKYGVKSGTAFITKYMGLAKGSISNYKKVADIFFNEHDSDVRDSVFSVYNFAQLQEMSVFITLYMENRHAEMIEAYEYLAEIAPAEFPYTMSAAKIRNAVKAYFKTVDENVVDEATGETPEATGETPETPETPEAPETLESAHSRMFTVLERCKSARLAFDDNGNYTGDDITNHFRDTLDFIIELLK